jgi:hypothetical protein
VSLLLFTPDAPPAYRPDFQEMSRISREEFAAIRTSDEPTSAPVSQSGAFALSAAEWRQLAAFSNTALQMRGSLRELLPRITALQEIAGAWQPLDGRLDGWPRARGALRALAGDITSYARGVAPPLYGRIAEILRRLSDGPDAALAAELRDLLARVTAEADERAGRAAQWSATIGPLADAARRFVEAFHAAQRNPAIRVALDEIPFMCLSARDGLTAAGDERNAWDREQSWVAEQVAPDGPFALRTADRSRTLFISHVDNMEQSIVGSITVEQMMKEGPRPCLVPTGEVMNRNETLFWFTGDRYIQPMQWPSHTLDCAGNGGWGQGTPVLNYIKNGGRNQKWRVRPRTFWDLQFYDACQRVAHEAAGIPSFQHLQGDWLAISRDLNDGISGVLHRLDTGVPFIAQLDVEATMKAWNDVASEAQMATAGL